MGRKDSDDGGVGLALAVVVVVHICASGWLVGWLSHSGVVCEKREAGYFSSH